MTFRIVTATLAVALAWGGGIAFAQEQNTQGDILDFVAPGQELIAPSEDLIDPTQVLDPALQSDLPLQGALENTSIQQSIAEAVPPQSAATPIYERWLNALRFRLSRIPRREIAMISAVLFGLFTTGWMFGSSVSRRRGRRAYRRYPRSSGGSRLQNLEEVVASVQHGRTGRSSRPSLPDPVNGREWPR